MNLRGREKQLALNAPKGGHSSDTLEDNEVQLAFDSTISSASVHVTLKTAVWNGQRGIHIRNELEFILNELGDLSCISVAIRLLNSE